MSWGVNLWKRYKIFDAVLVLQTVPHVTVIRHLSSVSHPTLHGRVIFIDLNSRNSVEGLSLSFKRFWTLLAVQLGNKGNWRIKLFREVKFGKTVSVFKEQNTNNNKQRQKKKKRKAGHLSDSVSKFIFTIYSSLNLAIFSIIFIDTVFFMCISRVSKRVSLLFCFTDAQLKAFVTFQM